MSLLSTTSQTGCAGRNDIADRTRTHTHLHGTLQPSSTHTHHLLRKSCASFVNGAAYFSSSKYLANSLYSGWCHTSFERGARVVLRRLFAAWRPTRHATAAAAVHTTVYSNAYSSSSDDQPSIATATGMKTCVITTTHNIEQVLGREIMVTMHHSMNHAILEASMLTRDDAEQQGTGMEGQRMKPQPTAALYCTDKTDK